MRPRITVPVLAAVAALGIAGPAAGQTPTVPPEVLAPGPGATTQAGAPVTFRVRTYPGDTYLRVVVSRSPAPAASCGTIGDDVAGLSLDPSGIDPSVYEGTPSMFNLYSFWLNRPGTYYWQAYRIHYGDGADGCVEAPVRALTVTGVRPIEVGPQPLSPADGAVQAAGPMAFRVAGMQGDSLLWIHVSRSPLLVDAGGLLGDDVELESLEPTADPGVYEARPTYFSGSSFWMNQAGVYWWQPYRISYSGDPDGRVEGPVRTFTIRTAPPVAPQSLTVARLSGDFTVTARVTSTRGFGTRVGRTNRSTWTFTPLCRSGACGVRLTLYGGILGSQRQQMRLARRGSLYTGSARLKVATCNLTPVRGDMRVTLRVTRGGWVAGRWRATRITGTYRKAAAATTVGRVRCGAGYVAASLTGTLDR